MLLTSYIKASISIFLTHLKNLEKSLRSGLLGLGSQQDLYIRSCVMCGWNAGLTFLWLHSSTHTVRFVTKRSIHDGCPWKFVGTLEWTCRFKFCRSPPNFLIRLSWLKLPNISTSEYFEPKDSYAGQRLRNHLCLLDCKWRTQEQDTAV
jgi:hypothetical protein